MGSEQLSMEFQQDLQGESGGHTGTRFQGVRVEVHCGTANHQYTRWMTKTLADTLPGAQVRIDDDDRETLILLSSQHLNLGHDGMRQLESEVWNLVGDAFDKNPHAPKAFGTPL